MAATLAPICLPESLAAGDQWRIEVSLSDYTAADGWSTTLYLRGTGVVDVPGVDDAGVWVFTVTAATTATKPAGTYTAAVRVTKAADVRTLAATPVTVTANIATAAPNAYQSHAAKMLPLLEAALLRRVTVDMKAYTITSRSATREELRDMEALRKQCARAVARERNGGTLGSYAVRFGRGDE